MALLGDGITFEPLTGDDLDDIAGLAADAWYSPDGLGDMTSAAMEGTWLDDSERDRVARLMATDEIAAYLQEMTWGVKALLKGRMVGVIVTHGTHTSAETAEHFGHVGAEARKRAEELLTAARERAEHPDNVEPTEPIYLDEIRGGPRFDSAHPPARSQRGGARPRPWQAPHQPGARPLQPPRRGALLARHRHGLRLVLLRAPWPREARGAPGHGAWCPGALLCLRRQGLSARERKRDRRA